MASFIIEGGHRLAGDIHPQGAKNEVLQIICATLLTAEKVTVHHVPNILDVNNLIQLMRDMGVEVVPIAPFYEFGSDKIYVTVLLLLLLLIIYLFIVFLFIICFFNTSLLLYFL